MIRECVCFLGVAAATSVSAQEIPQPKVLSIWNCDTNAGIDGLEIQTDDVKQGLAAVRWRNHPQQTGFSVPNVPKDWSQYHLLRLWIRNAKSVPARFMIIVPSENPATDGMDYWSYGVRLNFTGWREIVLPIGGKGGTRSPLGWDQIDGLTFTASGWSNTPHPEADVLIDDIRLQYDPPQPGPRMTDREFFESLDLSRDDLRAVRVAIEAGDVEAAKAALLQYMRTRKSPRWWFDWRDRPDVFVPTKGGSEGWDYFTTRIQIDWTGWKEFTLPLGEWGQARQPIGWHWINRLAFSSTYGDRRPSPETTLVLDDVKLTGKVPVSLGDFEDPKEFQRWQGLRPTTDLTKQGAQAALWSNLPNRPGLGVTEIPHDWSNFEALHFWAYSEKATGDVITITADSDTPAIVQNADQVLAHVYGGYFLGEDIDWEANKYDPDEPAFTREWTYGLNRFPHWRTLGQAYWATGDERYAKEWIAQMRDWAEDNPWPLAGTGNATLIWRTIEAGIRTSGSWPDALYYFLGSPSLEPDDLVVFLKSWIEHAHHLMRITLDYPEHKGNWVTMECNGLGHLGILLPECNDASSWLKTAADRLCMELDRQVYPDGAQKELTTGYHQVALRNFVDLYKIAHHNDVPLPADYLAKLERMYEYNLRAMTPEGRLPPLNDARYTNVVPWLEEGAELFGREDFRWAASAGAQGAAPAYTSVDFPYAGQYVMRSGWKLDDRYLLFESGPYGIGHQHEDKLSMFIYGYGRVLLTEAGTYGYDRSKYRRYVLGTWAHNTIIVDGQQQQRHGLTHTYETDEPLDNLWIHNELFDAADGVYDCGYGPKRDISVSHERTAVFVRPEYWVVVDRLDAQGPHAYDILWHLNNDAAAKDTETLAAWGTDEGVANLMVTPAGTAGLDLEIVVGRDHPALGFAPASRKKPIPVLDYKLHADGPTTLAWVLTPYPADRPAVKAEMSATEKGTIVTVSHARGTDIVHVAPRGESHTVTLESRKVEGSVAVVRLNGQKEVVAAATE